MTLASIPGEVLSRLSDHIEKTMGLHYPPERWADLRRGLQGAAHDLGFSDPLKCAESLSTGIMTARQMQVLAGHLTVGETYFFRDPRSFEVLAETVLPELIRMRGGRDRRLRLWSAACCTGEEAYSLAILLEQVIPDIATWHITILATDINAQFLQRAAAGVYGEWSFRDAPAGFKERYFQRTPGGRYAILPSIKRRVKFEQLNLVEDSFPSLVMETNGMDLILCRNVLMYFSRPQLQKAVRHLHRSLVDGGWLAVSPSEVSQALFPGFKSVSYPGATLYRKDEGKGRVETHAPVPTPSFASDPAPADAWWLEGHEPMVSKEVLGAEPAREPSRLAVAQRYFEGGQYANVSAILAGTVEGTGGPQNAAEYSLLARALANQSELSEALQWCDRWIGREKLDASAHYLRAVVLQEMGNDAAARQALQNAVYLEPGMVLAHFALGNLARAHGTASEANRHLKNALRLADLAPADQLLPEADGLTAGRLAEIITSLLALEGAAS